MAKHDGESERETYIGRIRSIQAAVTGGTGASADDLAFVDKIAELIGTPSSFPGADSQAQLKYLDELLEKWKWGSRQTGEALIDAHDATIRGEPQTALQILEAAKQAIAMPFYVRVLDAAIQQMSEEQAGPSGEA